MPWTLAQLPLNMIRTITLLSLLFAAGSVFAEGLYKWVEADGSITFSPNPPTSGVEYERVGANNNQAPSIATSPATTTATVKPQAIESTVTASDAAEISEKPVTAPSRLTYAPSGDNNKPGIVSAEPQVAAAGEAVEKVDKNNANQTTITVAASKQKRCEDLQKRVISLERRLKIRLSPADMDNTVVHMARYQKSFNQHCRR